MKHLSPEQVGALIKAAESDRDRLMLTVIYQHGLRVSECLALTRGHVVRGYLQLKPKKKGKRADERLDPATAELWAKVTAHILPRTLVFAISRQWASTIFHRCAQRAHIELQLRQGIHSLRHSLAHHLLDAGAPLPVVQKSLRHRSIGSTGVYLEADGRDVDKWRARALAGAPAKPLSLSAIQAEMQRLAAIALSMQGAQEDTPQPEHRQKQLKNAG
jgi:site-specific recombinase XerD